jgi:hypothetical protein
MAANRYRDNFSLVMNHSIDFARSVSRRRDAWRPRRFWSLAGSFGLLLTSLAIAGCSNGSASVSGTVTLDGMPVEGGPELYGTVAFYREDGGGAPAVGVIQDGGHYELATGNKQGLEPGNYMVGVAVKKILPPAEPGGLTRPQRLSDPKYAMPKESGFRADVKPGSNRFDFELQSKRSS